MPAIIANLGPFSWGGPHPGSFRPYGKIIVGFNVGGKARWTMKDLEKIVRDVRTKQIGAPDSTFVAQTGMYTHHDVGGRKGRTVTEEGAQVLIKNLPHLGTSLHEFRQQMEALAETICRKLKQEMVIVDWQERGKSEEEWIVTP